MGEVVGDVVGIARIPIIIARGSTSGCTTFVLGLAASTMALQSFPRVPPITYPPRHVALQGPTTSPWRMRRSGFAGHARSATVKAKPSP